jgi:hypothetical protein
MPFTPRLGFGVKVKMGDGATPTETFAEIAGIRGEFNFEETFSLIEVTNHSSPSVSGKPRAEYIGGKVDAPEITLPLIYDYSEATHNTSTGLQSKKGTSVNFEIVEPGSTKKFSFAAIIVGVSKSYPVEEVMGMDVTLKPTGAIVESDI